MSTTANTIDLGFGPLRVLPTQVHRGHFAVVDPYNTTDDDDGILMIPIRRLIEVKPSDKEWVNPDE